MGVMEGGTEQQGRITVFSISGCPHCRAAKTLLKQKVSSQGDGSVQGKKREGERGKPRAAFASLRN